MKAYLTKMANYVRSLDSIPRESPQKLYAALQSDIDTDQLLKKIPFLSQEHCVIKDRNSVEQKIKEFIVGGSKRLQLVTDFDYTLTKQRLDDGSHVPSSFGIFNACKTLPASFIKGSNDLFHKYRPIEIDPYMPTEKKIVHMIEWWAQSGKLLTGFTFDRNEIDQIAAKYKHALRDGTSDLFQHLYNSNIPVLVFSAGLGDSVISVLKHADVMHPNVKVVSNFLQFDENGLLNGFQVPMIHTFNKNETVLMGTDYYELVENRDHIILMGDSLGDADMANGVPASSHVLKIGFLFHHVEQNLEIYKDTFDIVLVDDQTMDVPRALFSLVEDYENNIKNMAVDKDS